MAEEHPDYADLEWVGNAKHELLAFPADIIRSFGHALDRAQRGVTPHLQVRPMQSIGRGVFELKDADERSWYRVVYLAVIDNVIYVLHCFEKRSPKTDRRDIDIARSRLAIAKRRIQERRDNAGD